MKQGAKIGIAGGCLVAAVGVYFVFGRSSDEAQLVAQETRTFWMCGGCGETADFTIKQVEALAREAGPPAPPMICAKCKEKKVYRALKCPTCQTPYFGSDVPDSTGQCSKCFPDAKPPPPEPEEIEVPVSEEEKADQPDAPAVKKIKRPKAA